MKRTTITFIAALTFGCRAQGLPEIPADQDAANPSAPAAAYAGSSDDAKARGQLTKSAFDGVKLGKGGHEGMNHGGMKMSPKGEGADDKESKSETADHSSHGAKQ